jgi:hypothetical protein
MTDAIHAETNLQINQKEKSLSLKNLEIKIMNYYQIIFEIIKKKILCDPVYWVWKSSHQITCSLDMEIPTWPIILF